MAVRSTKRKTTRTTTAKKKPVARKSTAKKTTARKAPAKKATARKAPAKKVTARKAPAKKATARKAPAKKVTAKKAPANRKVTTIRTPYSKTQLISAIADNTGLPKTDVKEVIEQFAFFVEGHVKKGGAGEITLPGLLKIKVVRKAAKPARRGINPFTGEETTFKAKPAHNVVKIKPLKKLKDMVA